MDNTKIKRLKEPKIDKMSFGSNPYLREGMDGFVLDLPEKELPESESNPYLREDIEQFVPDMPKKETPESESNPYLREDIEQFVPDIPKRETQEFDTNRLEELKDLSKVQEATPQQNQPLKPFPSVFP
jgi:hypothetical protein